MKEQPRWDLRNVYPKYIESKKIDENNGSIQFIWHTYIRIFSFENNLWYLIPLVKTRHYNFEPTIEEYKEALDDLHSTAYISSKCFKLTNYKYLENLKIDANQKSEEDRLINTEKV